MKKGKLLFSGIIARQKTLSFKTVLNARAAHTRDFPLKKIEFFIPPPVWASLGSPPSLPESVRARVRAVIRWLLPVVCELFGVLETQLTFADCFSSSKGKRNFHKGLTYVYNVASEPLDLNVFRSSEQLAGIKCMRRPQKRSSGSVSTK